MLTFIDKLDYKFHNNMPFTKAEKYFFTNKEIEYILKQYTIDRGAFGEDTLNIKKKK